MRITLISQIIIGVGALFLLVFSFQIFENNDAGYVQVKQAAASGDLSVRLEPGMYVQGFGTITTYKVSGVYDFSTEVRFNDASTATITGSIKYRLPLVQDSILKLHRDFRSYDAVHNDMVRQIVVSSLKQSATFFRAEDVYSTRRSDFIDLTNNQIKDGIYATTYSEDLVADELDPTKKILIKKVSTRKDKLGNPVINEISTFKLYNVELIQFVINDIVFDSGTEDLIRKRKDAEQERVVAVANAERAKQDAITAVEQGKANVAIAEASALVEAKKATVEAEKNTKVAEQQALQADQEKKAIIAKGEAEAEAAKLKVAAGLSPYEKATIEKETAIGVARELAKVKMPQLMVIGGSDKGGSVDPFTAVGLESFININKKFASQE